jgi:hypothetical protein
MDIQWDLQPDFMEVCSNVRLGLGTANGIIWTPARAVFKGLWASEQVQTYFGNLSLIVKLPGH